MVRLRYYCLGFVCCLVLAGCQLWQSPDPWQTGEIPFLSPASLGQVVQQDWHLQIGSGPDKLPVALSVTSERCALAAFTPFGGVLYSASYDGQDVTVTRAPFYQGPDPEQLLVQMQWAIWPRSELAQITSKSSLEVDEQPSWRLIRYNARPVAKVYYLEREGLVAAMRFHDLLSNQQWTLQPAR